MVEVEQVTIDLNIPSDEVRVVALQPCVHLRDAEPFQWKAEREDAQLEAIRRTLNLGKVGFGGDPANFTLFPEYSVPGLPGADLIDKEVRSGHWPSNSVVIAGVHGLRKSEYQELCDSLDITPSTRNAPDSVLNGQWVNPCLTWIKDRDEAVHTWVQLKIRPAWPEMSVSNSDMFCGSTVYVFSCKYNPRRFPCRFVSLVCFDWVASVPGGTTVCNEMLDLLTRQANDSPTPLDWVFVIQHNPGPNHPSFLNSTDQFLTDVNSFPIVERFHSVVLHANTAISNQPRRTGFGAFSACVFSPSAQFDCTSCRPTVCMQPSSLRGKDILLRCKDVVFREMGECIHVFRIRVPRFVTPTVADRTVPLTSAEVHPASEIEDPRLPGNPVPASVKWLNDSLDEITSLAVGALEPCPLREKAVDLHSTIISEMSWLDGEIAAARMKWAACSLSDGNKNTDQWNLPETEALKHVIHSLTSLGLSYDLNVGTSLLHGTLNSDARYIQVVAILGETHQDCRSHYDNAVTKTGLDPILVVARDHENTRPTREEYSKCYEVNCKYGLTFLDYQTLLDNCRNATDRSDLRSRLDAFLPREQKII